MMTTKYDGLVNVADGTRKISESRRALREATRRLQPWLDKIEPDFLDELVESTLSLMNEARELSDQLKGR